MDKFEIIIFVFAFAEAADDRRGFLRTGRKHASGWSRPDDGQSGFDLRGHIIDGCSCHLDQRLHGRIFGNESGASQKGKIINTYWLDKTFYILSLVVVLLPRAVLKPRVKT